jgi:hypothetical protein
MDNTLVYDPANSSGSPTGVLANFANQIVEWNGSAWKTKYEFGTTSNHNQVQVAVIDEGKNV